MKEIATQYKDKTYYVLPLAPGQKGIFEQNWQETDYDPQDFKSDNNIGIDLAKSNLVHIDLDSVEAIYFANKYLPETWKIKVISPDGKHSVESAYVYKNNGIKDYIQQKHLDETFNAELRVFGNMVAPPSICESRHFNKEQCKRIGNEMDPVEVPNLEEKFKKVCAAAALARLIKNNGSPNSPIYKTYSCLMRYTNWSESDRDSFVEDINNFCKFDQSYKSRIKSVKNSFGQSDKKIAGYKSLANTLKCDKFKLRDIFCLIGDVPSEGDDRKTIIDFKEEAMTEEDFKSTEQLKFLVSPFLQSEGLIILAGRPKSMKSFMGIDLAYSVVNGTHFLGSFLTDQGDVLLLSLEDGKLSHKGRIEAMGLLEAKKPTTFTQHTCPCLGKGFEESLELWIEQTDNPKLVIIDTFQKIKPMFARETQKANAYEVDYFYLSKLKDLAHKHKILIMYIHHLSQADRSHSWDKIMGSTGHQGVTDAMFMLEREEGTNQGTFKGRGREIADINFDLTWNEKNNFRYSYAADTAMKKFDDTRAEILIAMRDLTKEGQESIAPKDVAKFLDKTNKREKDLIKKTMQRMKDKYEIDKGQGYGTYKLVWPADRIKDDGSVVLKNF